jgi:hexokinase
MTIRPLTLDQLRDIQSDLQEKITIGLRADGTEIKALPAFVDPPSADTEGHAGVVDIGGTHIRAAVVSLGDTPRIESNIIERELSAGFGLDSAEQFFAVQAQMLSEVSAIDMPVGYCFSYPSISTRELDARLIRWTKEIVIPGVVGELVGRRGRTDATGRLNSLEEPQERSPISCLTKLAPSAPSV